MNAKIIDATPFGPVALLWADREGPPKVFRVLLSRPGSSAVDLAAELYPQARRRSCRRIDLLARSLREFLAGKSVAFPLDAAALATRPAFQQAVLRAEHAIPRGRVSTYGLIAVTSTRPGPWATRWPRILSPSSCPAIAPCAPTAASAASREARR